jgi:UDP-galactopyranose mutase
MENYEYIIVGAGIAGSVLANKIANEKNKKVLIIEQRNHIAGNCFDYHNEKGILIHKYGPHIFHTNDKKVWEYLSQFTKWREFQLELKCNINGKNVPLPFNLNTLREIFPDTLADEYEALLLKEYKYDTLVPILKLKESKIEKIRELADFIYEKVYLNYMLKQWGLKPEEIDKSVTERVPIAISKDDRYFKDYYQALPLHGYTEIFNNMLSNSNINILLNTKASELIEIKNNKIYFSGKEFKGTLIYTGQIDELLSFKYGDLPYRTLRFEFETFKLEQFQEAPVVSYPNNYDFTRITEYKLLTGQDSSYTTIGKEFPMAYDRFDPSQDTPYYPIPGQENRGKYAKYKDDLKEVKKLILVGRLAEYMYYNMDMITKRALDIYETQIKDK